MKHAREDYNRIQDPEGKIPDEEPVFLLRGQDKYAAKAVMAYADSIAVDPEATDDALDIAAAAYGWVREMEAWNEKKSPDMP